MQSEVAALTIVAISYRARCSAADCRNLARAILRYGDRSGRPLSNLERCHRHALEALNLARKIGLTIHDERESSG